MTSFSVLWAGVFFTLLLFAFPLNAAESDCITASLFGTDAMLEEAVRKRLNTELKIPIYTDEGPASCWRLVIEFQDKRSIISLARHQVFDTVVELDNFELSLWPRAIALSTSGLWNLAKNQALLVPPESTDNKQTSTPLKDAKDDFRNKKNSRTAGKQSSLKKTQISSDIRPNSSSSRYRVRFHLMTGARLIPKLRVGVFEVALGIGVSVSVVHFDLSLVGLWGRKSLDVGKIVTTGGGLRGTVFWQGLQSQNISLGIGPSVEVMGVFGYGRGTDSVDSHQGFSPVINLLLLAGGWFELSPRGTVHVAIGGGFSALHYELQVDGKTFSGISGGLVNFTVGFHFGRSTRTSSN